MLFTIDNTNEDAKTDLVDIEKIIDGTKQNEIKSLLDKVKITPRKSVIDKILSFANKK